MGFGSRPDGLQDVSEADVPRALALHRPGVPLQRDLLHLRARAERVLRRRRDAGRPLPLPFAIGNFLGPLLLGRFFDTVGRKPMIAGTYILSGVLLMSPPSCSSGTLTATTQTIAWCVIFFFASAGASAAYLTVSEIFPMETRAMAIAFFYATGTASAASPARFCSGALIEAGGEPNLIRLPGRRRVMIAAASPDVWRRGRQSTSRTSPHRCRRRTPRRRGQGHRRRRPGPRARSRARRPRRSSLEASHEHRLVTVPLARRRASDPEENDYYLNRELEDARAREWRTRASCAGASSGGSSAASYWGPGRFGRGAARRRAAQGRLSRPRRGVYGPAR